jgi:two-component system, NarL family, sensor kinase
LKIINKPVKYPDDGICFAKYLSIFNFNYYDSNNLNKMQKLKLILYLCFITSFFYAAAQKKTREELFKDLQSGVDSIKLKANYQLAKKYLRVNLDTSEDFANKALVLAHKINDKQIESESYALLGAAQKYRGQFEKASEYHLKALAIKEKYGDDYGMSITLNDIGIVYKNNRRYAEALTYYRQSLEHAKKAGELKSIAMLTSNIATVYIDKAIFDSALYYLNQALPVARQSGDSSAIVTVLSNLGEVNGSMKKYPAALNNFYQCLIIDKIFDDKYGMIIDYADIGGVLMKQKLFDEAKPYLDSAYGIAEKENFTKDRINVLNSLVTYYTAKGDLEKADELSVSLAKLKDSTQSLEIQKNISELSAKYETAKKEKQIQQQQFELVKRNYWLAAITGLLLVVGLLAYSFYRSNKLQQAKKLQATIMQQQDMATKAIIEAEENERKRIAGDLHDGVGQTMSAAKMNLSSIESRLDFKNDDDKIAFEKIVHLVDESCKEVRSVSHNMMPNALLKSGLSSAVKEFIEKIDNRILKVNLFSEGLNERLNTNVETVLYRIIQECVNNVIKHSGANELDISLIKDADGIAATIEDNGKGFVVADKQNADGIGLKNIKTRIEYLKGTVDFDSAPGKGTLVAIHVPLNF